MRVAICDDEIGTCSDIENMLLDYADGNELIREQLQNEKVGIVYISSSETYAMSLFQVRPLDFLIKPITKKRIADVLDKFIRLHEINKQEFYYKTGKSVCRLYFDEIRYFACSGKKIEVYTESGKDIFYVGMRDVWRQAAGKGFIVIHKSYIINMSFVSIYHNDSVQMSDGVVLPISQRYCKIMREKLTEKYGGE